MQENNRDYYATYAFYTEKGERLAAFAREDKNLNRIEVTIIKCSEDDMDRYSRKLAQRMYREISEAGNPSDWKYSIMYLLIEEGQSINRTFIRYMEDTYFKSYIIFLEQRVLGREKDEKAGRLLGKPVITDRLDFLLDNSITIV